MMTAHVVQIKHLLKPSRLVRVLREMRDTGLPTRQTKPDVAIPEWRRNQALAGNLRNDGAAEQRPEALSEENSLWNGGPAPSLA
jgi:hypothetical protein